MLILMHARDIGESGYPANFSGERGVDKCHSERRLISTFWINGTPTQFPLMTRAHDDNGLKIEPLDKTIGKSRHRAGTGISCVRDYKNARFFGVSRLSLRLPKIVINLL
jgi:hypothetical protein